MNLQSKIEAYLFWKGEPQTLWEISVALRADPEEVKSAVAELQASLAGRGLRLVMNGEQVMLGTAPEMSDLFESLRKEELSKDLSKAALETLSIVLYRDNVTRTEINFIRGVNSSYILRNLEVRGLVERAQHATDGRLSIYKPTLELLSYLGISGLAELPDYQKVREILAQKLVSGQVADTTLQ